MGIFGDLKAAKDVQKLKNGGNVYFLWGVRNKNWGFFCWFYIKISIFVAESLRHFGMRNDGYL